MHAEASSSSAAQRPHRTAASPLLEQNGTPSPPDCEHGETLGVVRRFAALVSAPAVCVVDHELQDEVMRNVCFIGSTKLELEGV